MNSNKVYTIGFTQKTAEEFFNELKKSDTNILLDVRLNNVSQLAGFAKKKDLKYFLKEINNIEYLHLPELAPTKDILDEYKKNKGSWENYKYKFIELMKSRKIENLSQELFIDGCLLCSENKPHYCHRRLVVEYLNDKWDEGLEVVHL